MSQALKKFLEELGWAAQNEDFEDTAYYLKKSLCSQDIGKVEGCDAFTGKDKVVFEELWRRLLTLRRMEKDILAHAIPVYGVIVAAGGNYVFGKLQRLAGSYCQQIALLCKTLLEEHRGDSDEPVQIKHLTVFEGGARKSA